MFLTLFLLSCAAMAGISQFEGKYFWNNCHVFSWEGKLLKSFPGVICIPLQNGSLISSGVTHTSLIRPDHSVAWRFPVLVHHQVNLSPDGKRILILGSEIVKENDKSIRYDSFVILDMEGNVIAENSFRNLGVQFVDIPVDPRFAKFFGNTSIERSHFNSIYEIGKTDKVKHPALVAGNVIVNSLGYGIYVLSPDLKKILYWMRLEKDHHYVHDVQVLQNGNFLFFNNHGFDEKSKFKNSSYVEMDPVTKKTVYSFSGTGDFPVYSGQCGGVQRLNDEYSLISHLFNGAYIFSRKNGKIIRSVHEAHNQSNQLWIVQNLRLVDLSSEFIKAWGL